jgi:membrane-associated phospholipid phosphatase
MVMPMPVPFTPAALAGEYWAGSGHALVLLSYVLLGFALDPATYVLYTLWLQIMQVGLSEAKPNDNLPSN